MTGRDMGPDTQHGGRRRWLRHRPIRTKLAVILALPVLAVLALTGLTVVSAADRASAADQARRLVAVGGRAARLTVELQHERTAAVLVFAESSRASAVADFQRQVAATDVMVSAFRAEVASTRLPTNLQPLMARVDGDLAGLAALRQVVVGAPDAVLSVVAFRYRAMVADLIGYRQALGQVGVSAATANGLRAAAALSQAIESLSHLQVAAARAMAAGRLTPAGQQEIVAADTGVTEALQTFGDLGRPGWRAELNTRIGGGPEVLLAERLQGLVVRAQPGTVLDLGTDARGWSAALAARIDLMHAVEADLDTELLAAVTAERDRERRGVYAASGVVVALLVIVVIIGLVVARSLTGSLTRLQAGAIDVAVRRLPKMVHQLDVDNADPATVDRLVAAAAEPIPVGGTDEVGKVAEAFNTVTASAVRIAGEQAALRAGVGAILVSLSRRLQLRADAMMVSLDGLERDEQDPDRLQRLFELDHGATLIRRLIFNLQVLAGGRGGRMRDRTVPLADLVRAAGQTIEAYTRVQSMDVDDAVEVSGEAADELIHLLAELLDNAARSSPPDRQVFVDARQVGDLLHIQIRDEGTGMGEAELRLARERVAHPRRLDHRATQQMGLPVVGAIAHRLGIRIDFRSVARRGTWVDLAVPAELIYRRPAVREPTAELAPISAAVQAAPPPTWPPLPPGMPAASERPVIFEELSRDQAGSWFAPTFTDATESGGELVGAAAGWRPAARAAAPAETTRSGLPVRAPGQRLIPPAEPATARPAPISRQPERLRRQMSGLQQGIRAGRRQTYR